MPYIITTRDTEEIARLQSYHDREPRRFGRTGTWDEALERAKMGTRRAVATLADPDDANAVDYITDVLREHGPSEPPFWSDAIQDQIENLPDHGGTIGPLPDGTTIVVERAGVSDLYRSLTPGKLNLPKTKAFPDFDAVTARVIDAYNAAQAAS